MNLNQQLIIELLILWVLLLPAAIFLTIRFRVRITKIRNLIGGIYVLWKQAHALNAEVVALSKKLGISLQKSSRERDKEWDEK